MAPTALAPSRARCSRTPREPRPDLSTLQRMLCMAAFDYEFDAPIAYHELGESCAMAFAVVWIPPELEAQLPYVRGQRLRVRGEVEDLDFHLALQPSKGKHYLLLSKAFRKQGSLAVGDTVSVRFSVVDPSTVDLPAALTEFLHEDDALDRRWNTLAPGRRRGLAHFIASAKTAPTIEKRLARLVEILDEEAPPGP